MDPAALRRGAGHGRHDQGPGAAGAHRGRGRGDLPGVTVRYTPGHSAGHAAYVISAGGQRVLAFGDAFHSPIQIPHPRWGNTFDYDHAQSTSLREGLIFELAEPDTIGFAIHFPEPFGRVRIEDNQAAWQPIDA